MTDTTLMTLNTIYLEPLFSLNVQVVRSQLMFSQFTSFILPSFRGFVPKTCICICSNFMHWWADCDKIYQELNNQGNESSPSPSQQAAALNYYLSGISIHVNLFVVVFFYICYLALVCTWFPLRAHNAAYVSFCL